MNIKIAATQFSLASSALEIYISGCDGVCGDECHNKELWDFNLGDHWLDNVNALENKIRGPTGILIKNIWILGGEPLLNARQDMIAFLNFINAVKGHRQVVLFTRFEYDEIDNDIKELCDYIKCGPYDSSKLTDDNESYGIKLATSNQYIVKVSED